MSLAHRIRARLSPPALVALLRRQASVSGAARLVAVAAGVWFALAAAWGMFALPGGGHIGAGAAGTTMMAEQMLRWGIGYPAFAWYENGPPALASYYCHHPFGMYWASAIASWLFGHRDVVVFLPAVLMSAASVPLAYAVAERWGGPLAGAVAALGFVAIPINLGYANYHNLEVMCIFGALLFFWGHQRWEEHGRRRDLALSLAGIAIATSADWVGYLILAPVLGWALLRAYLLPRRIAPALDVARFSRWWSLSVALSVGSALIWVLVFARVGKIGDWLGSAEARGGAELSNLALAVEQRRSWLDFSFTPFAIVVGKVCAVITTLRLLWTRRESDSYPLALLFAATVQYVGFKRGADVHIYWPHYFGAFFALGLAHSAAALAAVAGALARRNRPARVRLATELTLAVAGFVPSLVLLPDSVRALHLFRATGGRYNDKGTLIRTHRDMLTVLRDVVRPKLPHGSFVTTHPSAAWGWEHFWAAQAPSRASNAVPSSAADAADPIWIGRASALPPDFQKKVARAAHVRIYGDVWVVDRREAPAPADAYAVRAVEPGAVEWFAHGALEPRYVVERRPDPFLTWEWRLHLDQPAAPPAAEPRTPAELRIAHNAAIEAGDGARAASLRARLERELDRSVRRQFSQGLTLLGVRRVESVQPRLELCFEAGGPLPDAQLEVTSHVIRRHPWSLVPADPVVRRMAWPPSMAPALWRHGFVYCHDFVLNHRIGTEQYALGWTGRAAPAPLDGRATTLLLELP